MQLVSMKVKDDDYGSSACMPSQYGYGLCLNLNAEQCEALGITQAIPAGTIITIMAQAIVESVTESVENDGDDKGNDIRMSLQITDLGLEPVGTAVDASSLLYGN